MDGVTGRRGSVQLVLAPEAVRRQVYVDDDVKRWSAQCQAGLFEPSSQPQHGERQPSVANNVKHPHSRQADRRGDSPGLLDADRRAGLLAADPRPGRCQANPTNRPAYNYHRSRSVADAPQSPSLAHFITKTAKDVEYNGSSLWDARKADGPYGGPEELLAPEFVTATKENKLRASKTGSGPLGSGSDCTVFLQRLGGFGNADGTGAPYHCHSIYHSQCWQELYADPGFHRHVAVAKHLGLLTLRIEDSIALPLNVTQYAYQLDDYLETVRALLPTSQVSADLKELAGLGAAIFKLQEASAALDKEKYEAAKAFLEAIEKLPSFPPQSKCAKKRDSFLGKAAIWVKGVFGVPPPDVEAERDWVALPRSPLREFLKAARRVQVANHKVRSFVRYGATTFPALTEAITLEKDEDRAAYEAARLTQKLLELADDIAVYRTRKGTGTHSTAIQPEGDGLQHPEGDSLQPPAKRGRSTASTSLSGSSTLARANVRLNRRR
ncbi:hypothetical protein EV121DRAFT_286647 [Schizophyllum commune]